MKILFLLLFLPLSAFAFLNTSDDTGRITVNVGTNINGYAVFYIKGKHKLTNDSNTYVPYCVLIDPVKLSTMQGVSDMSLYNLLWFMPSCSESSSPCVPIGAIIQLSPDNPWCLR